MIKNLRVVSDCDITEYKKPTGYSCLCIERRIDEADYGHIDEYAQEEMLSRRRFKQCGKRSRFL